MRYVNGLFKLREKHIGRCNQVRVLPYIFYRYVCSRPG